MLSFCLAKRSPMLPFLSPPTSPVTVPTLYVCLLPAPFPSGAQCDATGTKCLVCNGARHPPIGATDGRCALPCKQLFGIGCLKCDQTKCLTTDTKYAQGASLNLG